MRFKYQEFVAQELGYKNKVSPHEMCTHDAPSGGKHPLSSFLKHLAQPLCAQYGESAILEKFGHAEEDGP